MGQQLQAKGMHVAILDVEPAALEVGLASLRASAPEGSRVEGYICDVSSLAQVEEAAAGVAQDFAGSPIGFVCANAGVAGGGILTATEADWDWVLGVNVKGVAWMMRTFVPLMQAQSYPSVFCTTASILGLVPMSSGVYGASKAAAVAMCELLQKELSIAGDDRVSVHCLCPPIAQTNILASGRNRPEELTDNSKAAALTQEEAAAAELAAQQMGAFYAAHGEKPETVVAAMIDNVEKGMFFTILDNVEGYEYNIREQIARRMGGQISEQGALGPGAHTLRGPASQEQN